MTRYAPIALAAVWLLTAPTLLAQAPSPPAPEPSAADKATARALLDEGDALMKKGDAQGAHDKYQSADAIMGVPTTGYALAEAQLRLNQLVEAADTLARVQRYPSNANEPKAFTKAREDAGRKLAELQRRIPSATLAVEGAPVNEAMRVTIDGRELATTVRFLPRKLNPGRHEAVVDSGDVRGRASFTLVEGDNRTVTVPVAATGLPRFGGEPSKGDAGGNAAPPPTGPTPGEPRRGLHPGVWIGVGVGGAALALGAVTGGLALARTSDLDAACPQKACVTPEAQDDLDRATKLAHVSTLGFAVAGAAAGAALVTWLVTDDAGSTAKKASIAPLVGPGYLGVSGSF
jgi:hypothetical protein